MNSQCSIAYSLINQLYLKNRNFCSSEYDECLNALGELLPFTIYEYKNPIGFWQIPPKWDLKEAKILKNGKVIYEVDHPLKMIGLSKSIHKKVSLKELKEHLHYDHRYSNAIPYHFRQFYRPWQRTWGYCVPKTFYDSLDEGEYEVLIDVEESEGSLKVAEVHIEGQSPYGFVFIAHLDHPGMANDDLAGVAVGVELFMSLIKRLNTKLSYTLLLVPEIIGSEFYLQNLPRVKEFYLGGCFLEMLGSKTPLALQKSYQENSFIEDVLQKHLPTPHKIGPYKSIICNDETVWQSHGISLCSLSRFPYPEYHTDLDNPSIICPKHLDESLAILKTTIDEIENQVWIHKHFSGTPCTAHPNLNLYVDPGQRAFGTHGEKSIQKLRDFMDFFLAEKSFFSLHLVQKKLKIESSIALSYLKQWEEKKLITLLD